MSEQNIENPPTRKKNFYVTRKVTPQQLPKVDSRPISPINPDDLQLGNFNDQQTARGKRSEELGLIQNKNKDDIETSLDKNAEEKKKSKENDSIKKRNMLLQNNLLSDKNNELQKNKPMDPDSLKRSRFRYSFAFILIILFFSLALTGVSIPFFINALNDSYSDFDSMISTVSTGAYCSLTKSVIVSLSDCGLGIESQLTLGSFAGTKTGCYCPGSTIVTEGKCKSSSKCTTVNEISSKSFEQFNGITICGTTASFYYDFTCAKGYKACQGNTCVRGTTCPINDIQFYPNDLSPTILAGYTQIIINGGSLLYLNDITSHNVLMDFVVSHGEPCLAFDKNWVRAGYNEEYPLENTQRTGCGDYGSNYQSSLIDATQEQTVLQENSVSYSQLPLFSDYIKNQNLYLYARFAPKFNGQATSTSTCYNNRDNVCLALTDASSFRSPSKYTGFAFMISSGLLACGMIVQFTVFIMKRKVFHKGLLLRKVFLYFTILLAVSSIALFGILIAYMPGSSVRQSVSEMAEKSCFESEDMNDAFRAFEKYISHMNTRLVFMIVILVLSVVQTGIASILNWMLINLDRRVMNLEIKAL